MQKVRCTRRRRGHTEIISIVCTSQKENKKLAKTEEERPERIETNISRRRSGGAGSLGQSRVVHLGHSP